MGSEPTSFSIGMAPESEKAIAEFGKG